VPFLTGVLRAPLVPASSLVALALGACLSLVVNPVQADPTRQIAYLDGPTLLATDESVRPQFLQFEPLLVDDFIPAASGALSQMNWWGSFSASNWFVAIFTDAPSQPTDLNDLSMIYVDAWVTYEGYAYSPNCVPPVEGDYTPPEICEFLFFPGGNVVLEAGRTYWLSVANSEPGWYWARGSSNPAVGSQQSGARALCLTHEWPCDQWVDIGTNLAFELAVPEPGIVSLLAVVALAAVQAGLPRRHSKGH
jgi:hypothetical protein